MELFNVLVVDDEQDFLETLLSRLKKRNINATGVGSGDEALKIIKAQPFDIVILDIKMPGGMDGIEVLRELKRIQPLVEVLLLTGHASIETSIEGMKLGAFDYLLKPVKIEILLEKMKLAFERKREQDDKIHKRRFKQSIRYS